MPHRLWAAGGLAAGCLAVAAWSVGPSSGPPLVSESDDPITRYEARFRPLRERLAGERVVGYIHPSHPWDPIPVEGAVFMTQYALAPVLVQETLDLPLVVGNFHSLEDRQQFQ